LLLLAPLMKSMPTGRVVHDLSPTVTLDAPVNSIPSAVARVELRITLLEMSHSAQVIHPDVGSAAVDRAVRMTVRLHRQPLRRSSGSVPAAK
jgi:hypothetical protein